MKTSKEMAFERQMEEEILIMVEESDYWDFRDYLNWVAELGNITQACAMWYLNKFGEDSESIYSCWAIDYVIENNLVDASDFDWEV